MYIHFSLIVEYRNEITIDKMREERINSMIIKRYKEDIKSKKKLIRELYVTPGYTNRPPKKFSPTAFAAVDKMSIRKCLTYFEFQRRIIKYN